jgi:hypothetical protein
MSRMIYFEVCLELSVHIPGTEMNNKTRWIQGVPSILDCAKARGLVRSA